MRPGPPLSLPPLVRRIACGNYRRGQLNHPAQREKGEESRAAVLTIQILGLIAIMGVAKWEWSPAPRVYGRGGALSQRNGIMPKLQRQIANYRREERRECNIMFRGAAGGPRRPS